MAQVLRFPQQRYPQNTAARHGGLISAFSGQRREREDVFWLKENAELLNILECSGTGRNSLPDRGEASLQPMRAFYEGASRHLCFFRQYYRFILSICMDLEDLGLVNASGRNAGADAEDLAHWVAGQGLPWHELSDLQRAEARRLLARRGIECDFPGLDERLHDFINGSCNFAIPNRKAAYELTHIVFYLSDYGRRDPGLSRSAIDSLNNVGVLAFLDRDADLLAEVCIALRYGGAIPAVAWESWLTWHTSRFTLMSDQEAGAPALQQDDYHMFLVGNWHQSLCQGAAFAQRVPEGALRIRAIRQRGILNSLSQAVFSTGDRALEWQAIKPCITAELSAEDIDFLHEVEGSCPDFDRFFVGFARSGRIAARPAAEARA